MSSDNGNKDGPQNVSVFNQFTWMTAQEDFINSSIALMY